MKHKLAYHYTIGDYFRPIIESGFLDPARSVTQGQGLRERPILWFSTHPIWEPTACKAYSSNGHIRTLSMAETIEKGHGGIRFGCPVSRLHSWSTGKLRSKARMSKDVAKALRLSGIEQGATPEFWYGSLSKVSLSGLTVEVINSDMQWELLRTPETEEQ